MSRHWLLMPSRVDTQTHTYQRANKKRFQKTRHTKPRMPGLKKGIGMESEKVCKQVRNQTCMKTS